MKSTAVIGGGHDRPGSSAAGSVTNRRPVARDVFVVIVIAVVVRAFCFAVSLRDPDARQIEEDSAGYLLLAKNLVDGRGFGRKPFPDNDEWVPELCRTPGYPALIAALEILTGSGKTATIVLQHLLVIGLCGGVTAWCATRFGRAAGLAAGLLLALDVQGIALANLVLTEVPFGLALVLGAWLTAKAVQRSSLPNAALAGAVLGFIALVRPTAMILPTVVAVVWLVGALWRRRKGLGAACALAVAGNAVVGGWIVRNGVSCGEYRFSSIPRFNLLYCHAAGAIRRGQGVGKQEALDRLTARLGLSPRDVRKSPLSKDENARVKGLAVEVITTHKAAFVAEFVLRTTNTLFGPEKQILTVLGLDWVGFGIHTAASRDVPLRSRVLLGWQVIWLGLVYLLVLRTLCQFVRRRRFPILVVLYLWFAVYILIVSSGAPGDPRLRWPALPLLVLVGVASFRAVPTTPAARNGSCGGA